MKRMIFMVTFLLVFLTSCKENIDVFFEQIDEYSFYAISEVTHAVEEVKLDYTITNEVELFELYTIYQNYFPLGFVSPANPNITLIKSEVTNHCVNYYVDNFILLSDIELFHEVLLLTGKMLEYQEIHIFFIEKQLI